MRKSKILKKGILCSVREETIPNILVIMSTYNGEKYLCEQLDSILKQKGVNVSVLIRDDGSTDATVTLLKRYCSEHSNVSFYDGMNIGVVKSFNHLMMNHQLDDFKWIAFADQDDVWEEKKLIRGISLLEMYEEIPGLYCSNLQVVDSALNKICMMHVKKPMFNKFTAVVQNCATGCTCVFNQKALEVYRKGIKSRMEMHDYWMFLVCVYFGVVVYDKAAYIKYRQHAKNVVGVSKKNILKALRNIIKIDCGKREKMLKDFLSVYSSNLDCRSRKILLPLITYKTSVISRLKLIFSPCYHGYSINVTFGFKLRAILGKIY